jgi:uncharacterized protein YyaL (SSP411 family)
LYEAAHNSADLQTAVKIANKIVARSRLADGTFKTVIGNQNTSRMRSLPSSDFIYLKTQAHAGLAMLSLYQYTSDTTWLTFSEQLHAAVYKQLYDKEKGGMFSTNNMPVSLGGKVATTKVLVENGLYARFLTELSDLTGNEDYLKVAEVCLRSVSAEKIVKNEERLIADYVMGLDKLKKGHFVFTIVSSDRTSEEFKKMLQLVQSYYHPAKLIKVEGPGHYPDLGKPALFVCSRNVCSQPIFYSTNAQIEVDLFLKKLK